MTNIDEVRLEPGERKIQVAIRMDENVVKWFPCSVQIGKQGELVSFTPECQVPLELLGTLRERLENLCKSFAQSK